MVDGDVSLSNKPTRINLHVHSRLVAEVDSELQRDAHVVLHPPHLAVERDALLAEGVGGGLVLEGVDAELLAEALARGHGRLGEERVRDVDALVAEHVVGERHHGELDLFCSEDPVPLRLVVHAVPREGYPGERALVVLGLEAEVALDHDHNLRVPEDLALPDAQDVALAEGELLVGLCRSRQVIYDGGESGNGTGYVSR